MVNIYYKTKYLFPASVHENMLTCLSIQHVDHKKVNKNLLNDFFTAYFLKLLISFQTVFQIAPDLSLKSFALFMNLILHNTDYY